MPGADAELDVDIVPDEKNQPRPLSTRWAGEAKVTGTSLAERMLRIVSTVPAAVARTTVPSNVVALLASFTLSRLVEPPSPHEQKACDNQ